MSQSSNNQAQSDAQVVDLAQVRADRERDLLAGLKNGDPLAIEEMYTRFVDQIENVVHRTLGPDSEWQDVVQETFLHAIKGLPGFRGDISQLRSWLTRIAVIRVRRRIRYRKTRSWLRLTPKGELPVRESGDDVDARHALRRAYQALEKLPANERIVFSLRVVSRMTMPEIADACDVSVSTVKRRYNKGRDRFEALAAADPFLAQWLEEGRR